MVVLYTIIPRVLGKGTITADAGVDHGYVPEE